MSANLVNNIHFENWSSNQVADWLKGLDDVIQQYVAHFKDRDINGKKLMMLTHSDLENVGVHKLGHQELILEAVDLLKSLRYNYETENLQSLALQLGCKARSLFNEVQPRNLENDPNMANHSAHSRHHQLSVEILSSVADLIITLKCVIQWLDRTPFDRIYDMVLLRNTLVKLGIDLISACQKDTSDSNPEEKISTACHMLADYCDGLVVSNSETLSIQPASLEQTTIRKKPGEELGMRIHSAYYGVHVIGEVKDRSPADLCGKIEKGDEVVQVDQKTVVGWQLQRLVDTLKEKPKEVHLLLKKRPHHISPYGQLHNKRHQNTNLLPPQVNTLPSKKRRSREGEHNKQPRPSLQEYVSSVPSEDLYTPREEIATDEKDDGNDTDSDVFRSGSESPQYTLPVISDPKQRRATVSGGSPTLSRTLLGIDEPETPTRPKSFTVTSTDVPPGEFNEILGEDSNLTKLGNGGGKYNAQQKRQDYKSAKASPQSLEFTVKKPVPIVQEPRGERTTPKSASEEQQRTFQDLLDQKKVLDLLEVPSRFQNPNRRTAEEESEEKGACLSSPSSTDTLTDHSERGGAEEEEGGTPSPGPGGDTHADHGGTRQTDDNRHQDEAKEHRVENEATTLTSAPEKHAESSPPGVSVGTEDARTAPLSLMPKTAPQNLDASYIDRRRPSKNAATFSSVATFMREKSEPQLMKIRKIDSFSEGGHRDKQVAFSASTKPEDSTSYRMVVVGGVLQRMPVTTENTVVVMRPKKKSKPVDRRVSCKDLGTGDCEGWLYKKREKHGFMASHWVKRWCVIKQYNMYFYRDPEDLKAEGVLHLPAFKVSPAPEVRTRKYAFKVHNAGTSFVFASERQEDMKKWMNKMGLAAISFSPPKVIKHAVEHDDYFSESSDEDVHPSSATSVESLDSLGGHSADDVVDAPVTPFRSQGDLTRLMDNIHREQLTFDGKDKRKQRTSAILPVDDAPALPQDQIDAIKRKQSLLRTLKAKELELQELESILHGENKRELLKSFKEHHTDGV
ncbi:connector enhancer of kinase suppressor of ras 2-like isoform X2 [Crassostrea virginica]|uniref:Connector enhancer of kinase suppressor of ras 2-like isoform X4 n=1 Tax=Crassostrea virginica TaxID=6565 RepID=A0A8B8AD02_CRAVI|nr:connector enhancer of kinase suppressor of ras 2-like isoform X4 [Crassostrea virginica]